MSAVTDESTRTDSVEVHVHLVMTGTFPLRVADLLFTTTELLIPEYEYITPLFGILRSSVDNASKQAKKRYRDGGVVALLELAEETHRFSYEAVKCIRVYQSGIARPKVAVVVDDAPTYAYRIHAPVDLDSLTDALQSLGRRRNFSVERHDRIGFSPVNSLRRFFDGR